MLKQLIPLPAFNDNYIWAFSHHDQFWLVDPGCAKTAIDFLAQHNAILAGILVTHHHADHTGGITELKSHYQDAVVIGPKSAHAEITHSADQVGQFISGATSNPVPFHTLDHVCYLIPTQTTQALFCGDALFSAGCGRMFEGTPEQLLTAMQFFNSLPESSLVCAAHEYTLANLHFARSIEPNNEHIKQAMCEVEHLLENNHPSLPTTLKHERLINPFLRYHLDSVQNSIGTTNELNSVAILRQRKDVF